MKRTSKKERLEMLKKAYENALAYNEYEATVALNVLTQVSIILNQDMTEEETKKFLEAQI